MSTQLKKKKLMLMTFDNYYNHSGNTSDLKGELKFHFLLMLTYKFIPLDLITNIVLTIFLLLNFYNKYKLYRGYSPISGLYQISDRI